jgi:hypothetical protein
MRGYDVRFDVQAIAMAISRLRRPAKRKAWRRHSKGLSQDNLAYEAEISRSYLSRPEMGVFYAGLKIIGKRPRVRASRASQAAKEAN